MHINFVAELFCAISPSFDLFQLEMYAVQYATHCNNLIPAVAPRNTGVFL